MATIFSSFDTYTIYYTARGQGTQITAAVINCYMQGAHVAQIQFLPESLPFNNTGGGLAASGLVILYYEPQQFQDILAIVQREGPLAVWFDVDRKYGYVLTTTEEPVGELEDPVQLQVLQ
jgi:hypothetical protein